MNGQFPSTLLEKAVNEFAKLPGVGRKTAMRLVDVYKRQAYLLENGYQPWNILALTFTNKAARERKERIARQVGPELSLIHISFSGTWYNSWREYQDNIHGQPFRMRRQ